MELLMDAHGMSESADAQRFSTRKPLSFGSTAFLPVQVLRVGRGTNDSPSVIQMRGIFVISPLYFVLYRLSLPMAQMTVIPTEMENRGSRTLLLKKFTLAGSRKYCPMRSCQSKNVEDIDCRQETMCLERTQVVPLARIGHPIAFRLFHQLQQQEQQNHILVSQKPPYWSLSIKIRFYQRKVHWKR